MYCRRRLRLSLGVVVFTDESSVEGDPSRFLCHCCLLVEITIEATDGGLLESEEGERKRDTGNVPATPRGGGGDSESSEQHDVMKRESRCVGREQAKKRSTTTRGCRFQRQDTATTLEIWTEPVVEEDKE